MQDLKDVSGAVFAGSEAFAASHGAGASRVVTLGNFDGVHRGHQALLAAARQLAGPDGEVVAYTFDPTPRDVMVPGHGVPRIQSTPDRARRLLARGADAVVVEAFSPAYAAQEPEAFVADILQDRLGVRGVVVGYDFRFGRRRRGDHALLAKTFGALAVEVPPVSWEGSPISSTRVRQAVLAGAVMEAGQLMDHVHELVGEVVHGDAIGRTLSFPTANLALQTELRPPHGVYAVWVHRPTTGERFWGVMNIGTRPTLDMVTPEERYEVHLLDATVTLYGETLRVGLVDRIRAERAFDSVEALRAQIAADVLASRQALAGVSRSEPSA